MWWWVSSFPLAVWLKIFAPSFAVFFFFFFFFHFLFFGLSKYNLLFMYDISAVASDPELKQS